MPSDCNALHVFSLALIAQVVFLLKHGHPERHTPSQMPLSTHPCIGNGQRAWIIHSFIHLFAKCNKNKTQLEMRGKA